MSDSPTPTLFGYPVHVEGQATIKLPALSIEVDMPLRYGPGNPAAPYGPEPTFTFGAEALEQLTNAINDAELMRRHGEAEDRRVARRGQLRMRLRPILDDHDEAVERILEQVDSVYGP